MKFLDYIDSISEWSGKILRLLAYILTATVLFEVMMRYIFNNPTDWAFDTVMMMNTGLFLGGAAYVTLTNRHIKVDVIFNRFPRRIQIAIDLIYYIVFFFPLVLTMVWFGSKFAYMSWAWGEISNTSTWGEKIWFWKAIIPASFFLLLLQGIVEFIRTIMSWKEARNVT